MLRRSARVLVVEDERIVALDLRRTLEGLGYRVTGVASSASEALGNATRDPPDLVLMDIRLKGDADGIQAAAELRARAAIPVVFLTANADTETLSRALDTAPGGFLAKPFSERSLHLAIEVALNQHRVEARLLSQCRELQQEANVDPLTGLFNRRHLNAVLARELGFAKRDTHPVGLILLDLDHFKLVNDRFGHAAGDVVLRGIASLLRSRLRVYDVVCRYGGEEIVVVLPGATLAETRKIAEELRGTIDARRFHDGARHVHATASFGVASFPDCASDEEGLLRAADAALYAAKAAGRNCVVAASA